MRPRRQTLIFAAARVLASPEFFPSKWTVRFHESGPLALDDGVIFASILHLEPTDGHVDGSGTSTSHWEPRFRVEQCSFRVQILGNRCETIAEGLVFGEKQMIGFSPCRITP